jgi:hypothetical protein
MRKLMFSLLLAVGGAMGLAASTSAQAYHDDRIYVGIGDVTFSYGRPYWRYDNTPLYVLYERGYPRYYRVVSRHYGPGYAYPPPPAWGYRPGRDWRWDRDRRWDHDRRWERDGRRYPRHRDRRWD